MNRRAVITAAPTAGMLTMVASSALAATEPSRPLVAIYHRWLDAKDEYNRSDLEPDDPGELELFEAIIRCEEAAADFIPQTIQDYALKIVMADDFGCMRGNPAQLALVRQAREIGQIPVASDGQATG